MSQPIKAILTQESLDFALAHVSHYYDTDFFPRTEEFLALAYHWDEVDIDQVLSAAPIAEAWPKTRGGYRVVHRLEPLDALLYTAMAKIMLPAVEKSRSSPEIACSYRLTDGNDSFFGEGSLSCSSLDWTSLIAPSREGWRNSGCSTSA